MGYFKHDAVVAMVDGYDEPTREALVALRSDLRSKVSEYLVDLFVGPIAGMNGYDVWAILPDGSKEGLVDSDVFDDIRDRFMEICPGAVHVRWGGDDDAHSRTPSGIGAVLRRIRGTNTVVSEVPA